MYSQWWYWCDQVKTIVYACWVLFPFATYFELVKLSQFCQLYVTSQAGNMACWVKLTFLWFKVIYDNWHDVTYVAAQLCQAQCLLWHHCHCLQWQVLPQLQHLAQQRSQPMYSQQQTSIIVTLLPKQLWIISWESYLPRSRLWVLQCETVLFSDVLNIYCLYVMLNIDSSFNPYFSPCHLCCKGMVHTILWNEI